jgi:NiFe hydrogenase
MTNPTYSNLFVRIEQQGRSVAASSPTFRFPAGSGPARQPPEIDVGGAGGARPTAGVFEAERGVLGRSGPARESGRAACTLPTANLTSEPIKVDLKVIRAGSGLLSELGVKAEFDQLDGNMDLGDLRTADTAQWDHSSWPLHTPGLCGHDVPRGSFGHWAEISDGTISHYQVVAPTTWNASPRDDIGQPGPFEQALVGTPVADPEPPLELLRTVHSFDPCLACAVHVLNAVRRSARTTVNVCTG